MMAELVREETLRVMGKEAGKVDRQSPEMKMLSKYWHCWDSTQVSGRYPSTQFL